MLPPILVTDLGCICRCANANRTFSLPPEIAQVGDLGHLISHQWFLHTLGHSQAHLGSLLLYMALVEGKELAP